MLRLRFAFVLIPLGPFAFFACSHDWDALAPTSGAGGSSSSSSHAASSGGASSTSTASTSDGGAGTGGAARCGDGIINGDEECDDGNLVPNDGCTNCKVDCDTMNQQIKDPATNHCYWVEIAGANWFGARGGCHGEGEDVDLAALSSDAEVTFVKDLVPNGDEVWVGALRQNGQWSWSNGEPWSANPPWAAGEPSGDLASNCGALDDQGHFVSHHCTDPHDRMCERTPAGMMP